MSSRMNNYRKKLAYQIKTNNKQKAGERLGLQWESMVCSFWAFFFFNANWNGQLVCLLPRLQRNILSRELMAALFSEALV